ncbi:MAG: hypothetical protein JO249_07230 [Acidobacteria bacterium]|nr:hypothetical protein [Acidobacteriota bacterium]
MSSSGIGPLQPKFGGAVRAALWGYTGRGGNAFGAKTPSYDSGSIASAAAELSSLSVPVRTWSTLIT